MTKTCYNCGKATAKELFNYPICDSCKSKLKLFTEATIKKYYDPKIPIFCNHIQSSYSDVLTFPLKVYGMPRRSKTSLCAAVGVE